MLHFFQTSSGVWKYWRSLRDFLAFGRTSLMMRMKNILLFGCLIMSSGSSFMGCFCQLLRNAREHGSDFVLFLSCSAYRALYLINWIYRFFMEKHQVRWIRKFFSLLARSCFILPDFQALDLQLIAKHSLVIWLGSDCSLCRFLLLLHKEVISHYPYCCSPFFLFSEGLRL